jgi:hypothetical protein
MYLHWVSMHLCNCVICNLMHMQRSLWLKLILTRSLSYTDIPIFFPELWVLCRDTSHILGLMITQTKLSCVCQHTFVLSPQRRNTDCQISLSSHHNCLAFGGYGPIAYIHKFSTLTFPYSSTLTQTISGHVLTCRIDYLCVGLWSCQGSSVGHKTSCQQVHSCLWKPYNVSWKSLLSSGRNTWPLPA